MSLLEWTVILESLLGRKRLLKSGESFVLTFGGGLRMRDVPGRAQLLHASRFSYFRHPPNVDNRSDCQASGVYRLIGETLKDFHRM
jgi:hypothetical protein